MKLANDLRAWIEMIPTDGGGRTGPIVDDYRPHVVLDDGILLGVRVRLARDVSLAPGDAGEVRLQLVYPNVDYSALTSGAEFSIVEGPRTVGSGRVL